MSLLNVHSEQILHNAPLCFYSRTDKPIIQCVYMHSRITAIVWLCYSVGQLQLSKYTCRWENWITGRSMSYHSTMGGAVPISTNGNRATSICPLTSPATTNSASAFKKDGVRRARRTYIFVHFVYGVHNITQTRCTMALLLVVISEERRHRHHPFISGSQPQEKNFKPVQNTKSQSNLIERIHAGVMWLSIE